MKTRPWTMLLAMMAGWLNRHQQDMIDYLKEENKILREKLGTKRLILTDEQKRKLAILAKNIGRKALSEICGVFSPNTLLKWHRTLNMVYKWLNRRSQRKSFSREKFYSYLETTRCQMPK